MRIRSKILMLVIPLTILPLLLLGLFSYRTMIEDFERQSIKEDQQICLVASGRIEKVLDECRDGLLFLASPIGNQIDIGTRRNVNKSSRLQPVDILGSLIEGEKNPFRTTAQELAIRYSPFVQIRFAAPDGKELFITSAGGQEHKPGNMSGGPIFLPAVALSSINNNLFQLPPKLGNYNATTFTKAFYGGSGATEFLAGFIFLDLDLKIFSKILNGLDRTTRGYYILIDGSKNILAEGGILPGNSTALTHREITFAVKSLTDNLKSEFGSQNFIFKGKQYYVSSQPVKEYIASRESTPNERWYLVFFHSETPLLIMFHRSEILFFIILGIGIIIAIAGTVFISKKITSPLGKLTLAAKEFAKGNLNSSVEILSRDEIGQLAGDLNYMAGQLDRLIRERKTNEALIAIGKFSASLAHDLRNPVEGLKLLSKELYKRIDIRDPEYEIAETIVQSVDRLSSFLNQSLDFTRLAKPSVQRTDIAALADSTLKDFRFADVELKKKFADNLPLIELDASQIKRVLSNLIRNSLEACKQKAITAKGQINFAINGNDTKIKLEITDNGEGIPVELHEKIFEPFFSTKPEGHGLGLALARQVILNHGGSISVKSKVNQGTSFTIELPINHSSEGIN